MSENKHTPGIWSVHPFTAHVIPVLEPDKPIAAMQWPSDIRSEQETFANAVLMASAPALLAALQEYLPILERLEDDPHYWSAFTAGTGIATLNRYRAAIASATGQS